MARRWCDAQPTLTRSLPTPQPDHDSQLTRSLCSIESREIRDKARGRVGWSWVAKVRSAGAWWYIRRRTMGRSTSSIHQAINNINIEQHHLSLKTSTTSNIQSTYNKRQPTSKQANQNPTMTATTMSLPHCCTESGHCRAQRFDMDAGCPIHRDTSKVPVTSTLTVQQEEEYQGCCEHEMPITERASVAHSTAKLEISRPTVTRSSSNTTIGSTSSTEGKCLWTHGSEQTCSRCGKGGASSHM